MMTADQIELVQESFAQVLPSAAGAADGFYGRLFALAPETRTMFRGDMDDQGRKLFLTLATVVDALDQMDRVIPVARALAIRHVGYGVEERHYAIVGEALIATLRDALGDSFNAHRNGLEGCVRNPRGRHDLGGKRTHFAQVLAGRMINVDFVEPPVLFGTPDKREALRFRADGYVARATIMMRRARALVADDRMDQIDMLTKRRTALGSHFQRYQRQKHGNIFDPIVEHAPTSSKIVARTMKIDCMELGKEFGGYHSRWLRVHPSEWRTYKGDMFATTEKLVEHLSAELRAIRQLLMVAEYYRL